jgi:hypothetical protein
MVGSSCVSIFESLVARSSAASVEDMGECKKGSNSAGSDQVFAG